MFTIYQALMLPTLAIYPLSFSLSIFKQSKIDD